MMMNMMRGMIMAGVDMGHMMTEEKIWTTQLVLWNVVIVGIAITEVTAAFHKMSKKRDGFHEQGSFSRWCTLMTSLSYSPYIAMPYVIIRQFRYVPLPTLSLRPLCFRAEVEAGTQYRYAFSDIRKLSDGHNLANL